MSSVSVASVLSLISSDSKKNAFVVPLYASLFPAPPFTSLIAQGVFNPMIWLFDCYTLVIYLVSMKVCNSFLVLVKLMIWKNFSLL